MPYVNPVIEALETNGIGFNWNRFDSEILNKKRNEIHELTTEIASILSCSTIDVYSNTKLIWKLYNNEIFPESLSLEWLKANKTSHNVIALIYQFKRTQQFLNQYGDKLKNKIHDGRIYASWTIDGAKTGRMTCANPNIQAFSKEASSYFEPREGHVFVKGDYSQIELRVLAELSHDDNLIAQLSQNIDIHRITASKIFSKPIHEVTETERSIGKRVNFGICYGISAYELCHMINKSMMDKITVEQADSMKEQFYMAYPRVRHYHDHLLKSNAITSLGGTTWTTFTSVNAKVNLPVQASAAEGLKMALVNLISRLTTDCLLVNVIHDEIVLEAKQERQEDMAIILEQCMISGMTQLIKRVPVIVNIK